MSCIGWPREVSPSLHDCYVKKLLIPCWAGDVNDAEASYIAKHLTSNPRLRQEWEVAKFTRQRKKITRAIARRLAAWWSQKHLSGDEGQDSATVGDETGLGGMKRAGDID